VIEPWPHGRVDVLMGLLADPAMMEHLGGPETAERIERRQADYEQPGSGQYAIVLDGEPVGWVGYWERDWRDARVLEIGWSVLPAFQGRGLASTATAEALDRARTESELRHVHAFPGADNGPSNGICRKLGFELLETLEVEYPKGSFMQVNDWRFDLRA
jgi:RimJ/RimL family protein N-acetyltransferase